VNTSVPVWLGGLGAATGAAVGYWVGASLGWRRCRARLGGVVGAIAGGVSLGAAYWLLGAHGLRHGVDELTWTVPLCTGLLGFLAALFSMVGLSRLKQCRKAVGLVGGTALPAPPFVPRDLQGLDFVSQGVVQRMELQSSNRGERSVSSIARFVFPLSRDVGFRLACYARGRGLERVLRFRVLDGPGLRPVTTGAAEFDDLMLVKADDESRAEAFLTAPVREALARFASHSEPFQCAFRIELGRVIAERELLADTDNLVAAYWEAVDVYNHALEALRLPGPRIEYGAD